MKLLNPSRRYIASELERMAEMAKNKVERTRLEFRQSGGTTFKINYITMEIQVRTEDDYNLPLD